MSSRVCQRGHDIPDGRRKCAICSDLATYRKRAMSSAGTRDLTPDWYDYVAVERAVAGKSVGRALSLRERREYLRRMLEVTDD